MTIGYRSILEIASNESAFDISSQQFRSWLKLLAGRSKHPVNRYDWEGTGRFSVGNGAILTVIEDRGSDIERLLLELEHYDAHQTRWVTRLVSYSGLSTKHSRQMILLECEGRSKNGAIIQPGPPGIVRNMLQSVNVVAGNVPISDRWQIVKDENSDDLYSYITSADRHIPLIVAAPVPDVPLLTWVDALKSLTTQIYGCAAFFVLNEESHCYLNKQLGAAHEIPLGAVRTFVPKVHLDDPADGWRHRILTAKTLARHLNTDRMRFSGRLAETISVIPRRYLLDRSIPSELTRSIRLLEKRKIELDLIDTPFNDIAPDKTSGFFTSIQVDDSATQSHAIPQSSADDEAIESVAGFSFEDAWALVASTLKLSGHDFSSFEDVVKELDSHKSRVGHYKEDINRANEEKYELQDQLIVLQKELEEERFEHALTDEERRKEEKKRRSLERWKSSRKDRYEYVEDPPSLYDATPSSVVEIVERLAYDESGIYDEITKYVEVCDPERAVDDADVLDQSDGDLMIAARLWESIMVLRDYMKECVESGFRGGMHAYLSSSEVSGKKCPVSRHSENESDTVQTNTAMRKMREFRVPFSLDPSGKMVMFAHFKPVTRDTKAPRLYYYADPLGTQKAYIGYIGKHLKNTKTN
ncbi:hypothetical protein [Schaalia sp. Marseille-Q2122]|uniref:hypothetical protein n=1 Tax=Schaalia sp. Marseille-Q2122 TaxID=2736604 RepID=UPI00158E9109|nr:hypothetical protein [Schaalia sp. Marseille-Q2122]